MLRFSANLGFLWPELELCDRVRSADRAGFDAVECHWPYDTDPYELQLVLASRDLPMLALNASPGDLENGDFGLTAVLGRERQARAAIEEAIDYAVAIDCPSIHVMAGITGGGAGAEDTYRENLRYACDRAGERAKTILVEPINSTDVPGYHVSTVEAAVDTIESVSRPNLRLMFDCYHVATEEGDVLRRFADCIDLIGHVQIAAVPDRGEPDRGELDHHRLLVQIEELGYTGHIGAEYRPRGATEDGLAWLDAF